MNEILKYVPLRSSVNPSFWNKLAEMKLNVDRLSEDYKKVWGYYQIIVNNTRLPYPVLEVDSTSFNEEFGSQNIYIPFVGKLKNLNTIEQFKECDKTYIINNEGKEIVENIKNGSALENTSLLNKLFILSFGDLKKYVFYYWFCFPVPKGITIQTIGPTISIFEKSSINADLLYENYQKLPLNQKSYFLIEKSPEISIQPLAKIKNISEENYKNYYFVFHNISYNPREIGPQLRNFAALILHYCPFLENKTTKFIAFNLNRENNKITCENSTILHLKIIKKEENLESWVGWELDDKSKMRPRIANMRNWLDPQVLAANSVDLNLKLMKWRVMPNINLERIKLAKCLLLGSGTLGCSVARTLLAWGVRNITFVDNSTVSFSNPVRQSLFTYQDSVQVKHKATAAADNLKNIFPGVKSEGINLNVPMPGHSIGESMLKETQENVNKLIDLIKQNNIIFLLMDSRESRWLPTMLGAYYNKIVINAALGFDTYLVMRHGTKLNKNNSTDDNINCSNGIIEGSNLGCYFCNDVTAPGNSMKDRTLDQQCTVTRPGLSNIAGSLAVELAISLTQHKDGCNAPAIYKTNSDNSDEDDSQCVLGIIPHSIRGFLSSFTQILPATFKFKNCIACSDLILDEFDKNGFDFLLKVFNSSKYLEDISSLTQMFKETDFEEILELSDTSEEED